MIKSDMALGSYEQVLELAFKLVESNLVLSDRDDYSVFDVANTLMKMQEERNEKICYTDKLINYDDEIISIESMGLLETVDIGVTGDNLFYCNDILTKNSIGIPAIADWFSAIIVTDELKLLKQMMFKQLKNRYTGLSTDEKFLMGVDYLKMTLFDLDQSTPMPTMKSDKALNKKTVDKNAPFDFDMLHTIKPEVGSFADFNFDS